MPKRTFAVLSSGGTGGGSALMVQARKRLAAKRSAPALRGRVSRGYTRRGGFYGRFQGPAGELKFFDTALAFSFDTTAEVPATGQLNLIPQGVTESTRVGRKCTLTSIQMRCNMAFVPAAAAVASGAVGLALVQDTQANGGAAAVTDVLATANVITGLINMSNSSRFKILKRWVIPFNSVAGVSTAYNNFQKTLSFYRKLKVPLEFSSTTGAIGEIRSNNLFLMASATGNIDDLVTLSGECRVRFSDN